MTRPTSSRRCYKERVGRLPRSACRALTWLVVRRGLHRCIVLPVRPCVASFSKFHEPDTSDLLRTSSRGCYEDATRKLLPWNLSCTGQEIVSAKNLLYHCTKRPRKGDTKLMVTTRSNLKNLEPIFKILSLVDSPVNLYRTSHRTVNVSLHYLAKY